MGYSQFARRTSRRNGESGVFGLGKLDAKIIAAMWLRRAIAAILTALGLILYSFVRNAA